MKEAFSLLPILGLVTGAAVIIETQVLDRTGTNMANTPVLLKQLILQEAILPPGINIQNTSKEIRS